MSILQGFLVGAKAMVIQAAVSRAIGMATSVVLARGLGPSGLGQYSAGMNLGSSIYGLVRLGVDAAIHVDMARGTSVDYRANLGATLAAGLILLSASAVLAVFGAYCFADWIALHVFGAPEISPFVVCAGIIAAFQCMSQFAYAVLAGLNRFAAYARWAMLNALMMLTFSTIGMLAFGALGAVLGSMAAALAFALGLLRLAARELKTDRIELTVREIRPALARVLRFGVPHYMASLVSIPVFLYLQGLLAKSWGLDSLAIHRVIATVVAIILFVPSATSVTLTTALAKLHSGDRQFLVWDKGVLGVKATAVLALMLAVALCAVLSPLIALLFGSSYRAAYFPGVVGIFSAALFCTLISFVSLLHALHRSDLILLQAVAGAAAAFALGTLLIPVYGVTGYMFAELLGNAAALSVLLACMSRFVEWRKTLRVALTLLIVALLAGSAIAVFATWGAGWRAGAIAVGVVLSVLLLTRRAWLASDESVAIGAIWSTLLRPRGR